MIRFAIVGTNWITRQFIEAAHETGHLHLSAIYSRAQQQAEAFAEHFPCPHLFTSLAALAASDEVEAVYLASPNAMHCEQAQLFMSHGKHVICEKLLASNLREAEQMIACARRHQVILFEAFKTASLPNFARRCPVLARCARRCSATANIRRAIRAT